MSTEHISSTASGLKARLQGIAQMVSNHRDEINDDKVTIGNIKSAKDSHNALKVQIEDLKILFSSEVTAFADDFATQSSMQRAENQKNQQSLNQLKAEKTAIHQQLLAIQRRVEEIEEELGQE
jgi:hypothetical protein